MLIRRTLKFSILLVSMPCWSWWLIKSFAAPGWSSFETCPDPAGTIYFYFREKKKITSKFFHISSRRLRIIITQADTSNILLWRFLLDEASRKTSLHISHVWSFSRPEVCRTVYCAGPQKKNQKKHPTAQIMTQIMFPWRRFKIIETTHWMTVNTKPTAASNNNDYNLRAC